MYSQQFFQSVLEHVPGDIQSLVIVTHLVPGVDDFLLAVNSRIRVAAVIPKPNSVDHGVLSKIQPFIPILRYTRDQIKNNQKEFVCKIMSHVKGDSFAIIDTGGYFSHVLFEMAAESNSQLLGVVEDTENGHQKYECLLEASASYPCPVISVARSRLKDPEDFLVGQAVVFSADALLRETGRLLTGRKALVMGYGKIGSSIATHLRAKFVQVDVFDKNPARQALALAHGFRGGDKANLISAADLFFCATGNKSLRSTDFQRMKQNAMIFTATSGDDEIEDYHSTISSASPSAHPRISIVQKNGKKVLLCNDGNSANFMHGGIVGPFIMLVQAELIFALSQLQKISRTGIRQLNDGSKNFIADRWLDQFSVR